MNAKIARIETLLADGWDVEEIVSEEDAIQVLLYRAGIRTVVQLDHADARDVLYGDAFAPARPSADVRSVMMANH